MAPRQQHLAFLLVILYSASLAADADISSSPAAAPADAAAILTASSPAPAEVEATCSRVKFPKLCRSLISKYHPETAEELMEAAVKDLIQMAGLAEARAKELSVAYTGNRILSKMLQSCSYYFGLVSRGVLKDSVEDLKKGDKKAVLSSANGTVTIIGSCYNLFAPNKEKLDEKKFPLIDIYTNLESLSVNLFAIVSGPQK